MKIALAQINTTVGAIPANVRLVIDTLKKAQDLGADLVVFPEMTLTGYPPQDLLDRPSFVTRNLEARDMVAAATADLPAALVGFVDREESRPGKGLFNAVALCAGGEVREVRAKMLLPTYDVFDEARYFDAAPGNSVVDFGGKRLGITVCEDAWNDAEYWRREGKRRPYEMDPVATLAEQGADILINLSASPFTIGKRGLKRRMFSSMAKRHGLPFLHVNLVGGNDTTIFDGLSNVFGPDGEVQVQARDFEEALLIWDSEADAKQIEPVRDEEIASVCEALTLGLRDYLGKVGFKSAVIGLSGGIDSALTAALAVRAIGADRVLGVSMPSHFSSQHSRDDAKDLAEKLGIEYLSIPIKPIFDSYLETMTPFFKGKPFDVTEENLQARTRGNILMSLSNKFGHVVLSTGNKSEMAVGYCTLYGDMSGGLAVLSDVPKTIVFELSRYLNREREVIPWNTIEKPPSAELRPDQLDSDSLPPYDVLDPIMRAYVEAGLYVDEIMALGFERETVERIIRMIDFNEYKRLQAPIGLKITQRAFGYGRRMPVARGREVS